MRKRWIFALIGVAVAVLVAVLFSPSSEQRQLRGAFSARVLRPGKGAAGILVEITNNIGSRIYFARMAPMINQFITLEPYGSTNVLMSPDGIFINVFGYRPLPRLEVIRARLRNTLGLGPTAPEISPESLALVCDLQNYGLPVSTQWVRSRVAER